MARLPDNKPLLCYITDGRSLPARGGGLVPSSAAKTPSAAEGSGAEGSLGVAGPRGELLLLIEQAIAAGVDLIQIRERHLSTRALLALVEAAVARARGTATRILVNDRLDVALAAGAGLHLPTHGFPVADVRRAYPALLIGASCHNRDELHRAEAGGADFIVFGPVFETPAKKPYGPPLGLEKLREAVGAAKIPVLALGGVTLANAAACLAAGAAGLAAISLFQHAADLADTVRRLRALTSE